ncbi:NusB antitermination factor [Rubellimicrobium thermophilum DSM 16684]|uniref:NusB antitermination factor n=2 Tax=Rubellimicrobium TaxID=295418 RepID=S9QY03_9RHOB|nr:NusB antitermination factor [Rubellimicrobium thermophilum DSM 16684]
MMDPVKRRQASAARLHAVQALFQMEAAGVAADHVLREFETYRFGEVLDGLELAEGDVDLFRRIVLEAVNHQARIDQMTDRALVVRWRIERLDATLRALFRAAGAELVALDTPPKVIISQYLDVAEAFYPDLHSPDDPDAPPLRNREKAFVNAVLDHMAREARPEAFARSRARN